MQTLALCMIVRDEAAMLPQFLKAASGLWDELCVVDTGSVDETTQLVRMAGGRVQNVLWNDDFAEARNVSLEMASSDWIIVLDADELVSQALVQSARAQLERVDRGACVLPFVSMNAAGHLRQVNHLRMFKRHPDLKYRYRLHEDIVGPAEAYLTRTQLGVGRLLGHVEHLGDTPERQAIKNIRRRDKDLCVLTLQQDAYDLQGWYEQVRHALRWEDAATQDAIVSPALSVLRSASDLQRECEDGLACNLLLAVAACVAKRSLDEAIDLLYTWERRLAVKLAFYIARAELLARADRPSAAAADFEHALALSHTSFDVQTACIRPLIGLAALHERQNDLQEAQRLVTQALGFDARDAEALATLARLSRRATGPQGLQAAAVAYIAQYGDCHERQLAFTCDEEGIARA